MIDLNALFAEFLSKAIAAAVAEQTQTLTDKIAELEQQIADFNEKVDEADVERAIERHMEGINFNEMLDMDNIVECVTDSRGFNEAVRESLIDTLSRAGRY